MFCFSFLTLSLSKNPSIWTYVSAGGVSSSSSLVKQGFLPSSVHSWQQRQPEPAAQPAAEPPAAAAEPAAAEQPAAAEPAAVGPAHPAAALVRQREQHHQRHQPLQRGLQHGRRRQEQKEEQEELGENQQISVKVLSHPGYLKALSFGPLTWEPAAASCRGNFCNSSLFSPPSPPLSLSSFLSFLFSVVGSSPLRPPTLGKRWKKHSGNFLLYQLVTHLVVSRSKNLF